MCRRRSSAFISRHIIWWHFFRIISVLEENLRSLKMVLRHSLPPRNSGGDSGNQLLRFSREHHHSLLGLADISAQTRRRHSIQQTAAEQVHGADLSWTRGTCELNIRQGVMFVCSMIKLWMSPTSAVKK